MARASQAVFNRVLALYARTLRVVLDHQPATLLVAVATLGLTLLLYVAVPKGLFPIQDTGVILGISEAPQSVSFPAMAQRQRALAQAILQRSRGRDALVVHRHRRHQRDAQQRAHADHAQAARGAAGLGGARSSTACARGWPR